MSPLLGLKHVCVPEGESRMTRLDLMTQLSTIHEELARVTLAVEEALRPVRAELLLGRLTALEHRVDDLIDALPTLEDA